MLHGRVGVGRRPRASCWFVGHPELCIGHFDEHIIHEASSSYAYIVWERSRSELLTVDRQKQMTHL